MMSLTQTIDGVSNADSASSILTLLTSCKVIMILLPDPPGKWITLRRLRESHTVALLVYSFDSMDF